MNDRLAVGFSLLLCIVVLYAIWPQPAPAPVPVPVPVPGPDAHADPAPDPDPAPTAAPPAPSGPPTAEDGWTAEAYTAIFPDRGVLRCSGAGLLDDGAYEARAPKGQGVDMVVVHQGMLTASPHASGGSALVQRDKQDLAVLRWAGVEPGEAGGCTVEPVTTLSINGVVVDDAGKPVPLASVRGCDHGEVVASDGSGAFSLSVVQGMMCRPVVFVERGDGALGVGDPVELVADIVDVEGVRLSLPREDQFMDVMQQERIAEELAKMTETVLDIRVSRTGELAQQVKAGDFPDHAAAELRLWLASEAVIQGRSRAQLEGLKSEAKRIETMREAWLNQY